MLVKSPAALLITSGSLHKVPASISRSSTSSSRGNTSTRQQPCAATRRKSYATIAGDNNGHHENAQHEPYVWPRAPDGHPHPTPYQIFAMRTNGTYSKARYYELVKLYHPDRTSNLPNYLSPAVRLERYRLIVAAHAILSDPSKRSAYDRFGAGWNGKADLGVHAAHAPSDAAGPFSRSWRDPSDPVWQNATWEDWERYYEWRARKEGTSRQQQRQTPVYFQNSYFVVLVALLAVMGSTANSLRAHDAGAYFIQQRDLVHDRAARELKKVRQDAITSGSRQDRIDWFLRNREATLGGPGSDAETLRREKVERLLPERETCNGGETLEKGG